MFDICNMDNTNVKSRVLNMTFTVFKKPYTHFIFILIFIVIYISFNPTAWNYSITSKTLDRSHHVQGKSYIESNSLVAIESMDSWFTRAFKTGIRNSPSMIYKSNHTSMKEIDSSTATIDSNQSPNSSSNVVHQTKSIAKAASPRKVDICIQYNKEVKLNHVVMPHVTGNRSDHAQMLCLVTQLAHSKMDRFKMVATHWQGKYWIRLW